MFDNNINYDFITRFLRNSLPARRGLLNSLEEYAKEHDIPIAQPEVARFLQTLITGAHAKNILEIGTAIGYSTINMAIAAPLGYKITTIEKNPELAQIAAENTADLNVEIEWGDAVDILPRLTGPFDFIFLDAAKAQYSEFLPYCLRILRPGGLLVSDNVLYKGMVATDDLRERRQITIIKRMRKYLEEITSHPSLVTSIIPLGDGVAVSVYNGDEIPQ